jgi:hypothetical protein
MNPLDILHFLGSIMFISMPDLCLLWRSVKFIQLYLQMSSRKIYEAIFQYMKVLPKLAFNQICDVVEESLQY